MITESVVLALLGGTAGVLVAWWAIGALRLLAPSGTPVLGLEHFALEPRVLGFTFLVSLLTGLLFGVLPAWHLASQDVTDARAPLVVVVNETMARRYWPGTSPVGKRIALGGTDVWREVVGVIADVRHWGLDRVVNPEMYFPQVQLPFSAAMTFVLQTKADPASLAAAAREQVQLVDGNLPLSDVRTMDQVAALSMASRRGGMLLLSVFGLLALTLAAAGIYGVMSHLVALRRAEIGIRMTLGAQPSAVMALVLKEGLLQAAVGLAIGIAGGVMAMRTFRAMLFEVEPADPVTIAAVTILLFATAALACIVPARRAMRVDPVEALRS